MKNRSPVSDWTTDFDHYDPEWTQNQFDLWTIMRERCAVARSQRYGGIRFPMNWSDVRAIATNPVGFSSRYVDIREKQALPPDFAPPITTDPPGHKIARGRLAPGFSRLKNASFSAVMSKECYSLIRSLAYRTSVDAVIQYARPASAKIVECLLNIPAQRAVEFQSWGFTQRIEFIDKLLRDRSGSLGTDLASDLIREAARDPTLDVATIKGSIYLVMIAGVDTTAAVISGGLLHLATNHKDQTFLRERPDCIAMASEEFLRVYAPVVSARVATRDTALAGCPMQAGEMVLLSFAAANRDPNRFPDPETVLIHRSNNKHAAFGMGAHHCLGAELARQLIQISLRVWLATMPAFRLSQDANLIWTQGSVRGLHSLPLDMI